MIFKYFPGTLVLLLLLLLALGESCTPAILQYENYIVSADYGQQPKEAAPNAYQRRQYENWRYLPDTVHPEYTPERTLLVSFHFMNTKDTFYRQYETGTYAYIHGLLQSANNDLKKNRQNWLNPSGVENAVYPVNFQMKLANKPGTYNPAIYHHYDDELYYFTFRGRKRNLGDRKVISKYGEALDSILNIFIMPPHRDSLSSPTFKPNEITGVFLGNSIKLAGFFPERKASWQHRGNLNHEVGHALSLRHAWLSNDGCDDTRVHRNKCWNRSQSAYCDTMTSNNVMDYSAQQVAWTPCQIGRIHARMSDPSSQQRKWVKNSWCHPETRSKIIVDSNTSWQGGRDFRRSIQVKPGATLFIDCRVHLAKGQTITIEPGAKLELGPRARLHNDCGDEWGGIVTGIQGRKRGEVIIDAAATIENLAE